LLYVNVLGTNFFTLFRDQHKMMFTAANKILEQDYAKPDTSQNTKTDNCMYRRIYYNLKALCTDEDGKIQCSTLDHYTLKVERLEDNLNELKVKIGTMSILNFTL